MDPKLRAELAELSYREQHPVRRVPAGRNRDAMLDEKQVIQTLLAKLHERYANEAAPYVARLEWLKRELG